MLLAAVALKLVPVMVTVVPILPLVGVNEVMVGCAVPAMAKAKFARTVKMLFIFVF